MVDDGLARDSSFTIDFGEDVRIEATVVGTPGDDALVGTTGRDVSLGRTVLFHHDPLHSDERLDLLGAEARERWVAAGGAPEAVEMARWGAELDVRTLAASPLPTT